MQSTLLAKERKERKSGRKKRAVCLLWIWIHFSSFSSSFLNLSQCLPSSQRLHLNSIFPSPLAGALASAAITTCFPALCTHKSAPTSSEPFFLRRKDTLPFPPPSHRPLSLIGYPIPPVISSELVGESIPSALLYSTETEKSRFPVHVKQCWEGETRRHWNTQTHLTLAWAKAGSTSANWSEQFTWNQTDDRKSGNIFGSRSNVTVSLDVDVVQ